MSSIPLNSESVFQKKHGFSYPFDFLALMKNSRKSMFCLKKQKFH